MMRNRIIALIAAAALVFGLAACGDDDDAADGGPDTTVAGEETSSTTGEDGGEGEDEEGAPEANPCAEGESGTFGETAPPADDATEIDVTATDYAFDGLDAITETGEYAITLTNDGEELHEISLVRLADEETPIEEIIASEEEPELTEIAFSFACPGATAEPAGATIDEPGRYVAVCFIPEGATPDTPPEEFESLGPPHAALGMVVEFFIEA
jgi:hypothetical protein